MQDNVNIHDVKLRFTYYLGSMVRKEPPRNQWLKIIAEKKVAEGKLWKPIFEKMGMRTLNPQSVIVERVL